MSAGRGGVGWRWCGDEGLLELLFEVEGICVDGLGRECPGGLSVRFEGCSGMPDEETIAAAVREIEASGHPAFPGRRITAITRERYEQEGYGD